MSKGFFIRGFDSELHDEIIDMATREHLPIASIFEDAVRRWLVQNATPSGKHVMLLHDGAESLTNILRVFDGLTKEIFFRAFIGPKSHYGIKVLSEYHWYDGTPSPNKQISHATKQYCSKAWRRIIREAKGLRTCAIGFVGGDLAHVGAVDKAIRIEGWYNSGNKIPGVMYCPYLFNDLLHDSLEDMLSMLKNHDQTYFVTKKNLHKFRITEESLRKMPI